MRQRLASLPRGLKTAVVGILWLAPAVASAKTDTEFYLGGYHAYTRLERASGSGGSSFSLISKTGNAATLTIVQYLVGGWNIHLTGVAFTHEFVGPTNRTLVNPDTGLYSAGFGTEVWLGDLALYLQGNQRTLILLNDQAASVHELKALPLTSGQLGMKLRAASRFGFGIEVELAGGMGLSKPKNEFNDRPVSLSYSALARCQILFGSRSATGVTSIKFGGSLPFQFRYGFNMQMLVDEYKNDDFTYATSHLYGGLLLGLIF